MRMYIDLAKIKMTNEVMDTINEIYNKFASATGFCEHDTVFWAECDGENIEKLLDYCENTELIPLCDNPRASERLYENIEKNEEINNHYWTAISIATHDYITTLLGYGFDKDHHNPITMLKDETFMELHDLIAPFILNYLTENHDITFPILESTSESLSENNE